MIRISAGNPAALIQPSSSLEDACQAGTCDAAMLKYGVFADWNPGSQGADVFVLPSEMQAMAWDNQGADFGSWPTAEYSGGTLNSSISPTALGNVNNSGYADVIFSTALDGKGTILAYEYDTSPPVGTDFPITLPDNVLSYGGFSIADIDRDGTVEIVFGTSDGYLHCWELGSCSTGYAPWTQFQHDDGRTGVLE